MNELDRAGLDRILPAASASADWEDVLHRFRAHRSRRRRRTVVAAFLAVVLLLPAYSLGGRLLQLISPGTGPEVWGISWSPDGSRLAFGTGWVDDTEAYVLTADGDSWQLTRVGEAATWPGPVWSPDGESLAFVTTGAGKRGVHVVNADGSALRTVAPTQALVNYLAWSPDGRQLAFVTSGHNDPGRNRQVFLVNLDGSGRRNLTRDWGVDIPVWSPDGRLLAFAKASSGSSIDRAIYVANADGSGRRKLTHGPRAGDPRWSPDGRRIAYQTSSGRAGWSSQPSGPGGRLEIHVVNVDGSGRRRLAQDAAGTAWSPDGRKIAFTSCCRGTLQRGRGPFPDVFVINADGSAKRRLSRDRSSSFHSWSPDSRRILYVSSRGNNEIYVVNPDGSGRRNLTRNPTFDGQPAWSPDGRRIAFASKRDGEWGIYVMNADGSGQKKLAAPRG